MTANADAELLSESLASTGILVAACDLPVEASADFIRARLPDGRVGWLAVSPAGRMRLATEGRLLRVLARRTDLPVPRLAAVSANGDLQVRTLLEGVAGADALTAIICDPARAARIGTELGLVLAQLHTRVIAADVANWLPHSPEWPESGEWIGRRLPEVTDDASLRADCMALIARVAAMKVDPADRVLVHGDLGVHNIVADASSLRVTGVFDWEAACWADRHIDFRYFVTAGSSQPLLDAAIAAYEPVTGRKISRARVREYNAAIAVTYLAFRVGVSAAQRWCGRTLAQDLAWTREALAA
ncbi:MAG: aminoglycoside phosphotransferase family protein [Gemmatimonadota bacterium]